MLSPLALIGIVIFIVGGIGCLLATFRTGLAWGLSCLLVPPIVTLYVICHWSEAKGPFKIQLVGFAIIALSTYL